MESKSLKILARSTSCKKEEFETMPIKPEEDATENLFSNEFIIKNKQFNSKIIDSIIDILADNNLSITDANNILHAASRNYISKKLNLFYNLIS